MWAKNCGCEQNRSQNEKKTGLNKRESAQKKNGGEFGERGGKWLSPKGGSTDPKGKKLHKKRECKLRGSEW